MHAMIAQAARMAAVQTTIKTELCSFSEYRIYPGRGQKFVARDGKVHTYIHSKEARLGRQKLKAAKLRWTLVRRHAQPLLLLSQLLVLLAPALLLRLAWGAGALLHAAFLQLRYPAS